MRGKVLLIVDDGGKIRDYIMTVEEADKAVDALEQLEDVPETTMIALSDTPEATADEVIRYWSN